MTVFKKGKKWVVQVHDPSTGRNRQIGTFNLKRDADLAEQAATERSTGMGEKVATFAGRWVRDYPRPRESTNMHNAERIRVFAEHYAKRRMDSITLDEARAWALKHRGQIGALRAMFNDARRSGIVRDNPFANLRIGKGRGRRDIEGDWLTVEQVDALADKAVEVHGDYGEVLRSLILVAAYTGMRPGELYALRRQDVMADSVIVRRSADSKTKTIQKPKNGLERTVVLVDKARGAIDSCPQLAGQSLVFYGPRGRQLWQSSFAFLWNPVRAAWGRPSMALYELRHFCATYLLELGLSPADVAVQLGHTDGGALVLSTYGHPSERAARERIKAAVDGVAEGRVKPIRRAWS